MVFTNYESILQKLLSISRTFGNTLEGPWDTTYAAQQRAAGWVALGFPHDSAHKRRDVSAPSTSAVKLETRSTATPTTMPVAVPLY
jgi:hypothetical protein